MSSTFRSILQQVTQEKLEELKLQKNLLNSHFLPILSKLASDSSASPKSRLSLLHSGVKSCPVSDAVGSDNSTLIESCAYLLSHSEQDPSISSQLLESWVVRLKEEIQYALRKSEYSYLYGCLLSEWLELEEKRRVKNKGQQVAPTKDDDDDKPLSSSSSDASKLSREKTLSTLKSLLFSPPTKEQFSAENFTAFLSQELFCFKDNLAGQEAFHQLKKETGDFFKPENYYISTHDVQCCIKGLNSEQLLSPEKKAALKELSDNPEALEEVASLLTNRLKNLERWDWPSNISSEVTEIRRGLAGEWKPFLNEDIITALFLQYVGVEWAAHFKRMFFSLYDSKGWTRTDAKDASIEGYRSSFYRSAFLSCLPDSVASQENKNQDEYARVSGTGNQCGGGRLRKQLKERREKLYQIKEKSTLSRVEQDDIPIFHALGVESEVMMDSMPEFNASMMRSSTMSFSAAGAPQSNMMQNQMAKRSCRQMMQPPPPHRILLPPTSEIDFKQQFLHLLTTEIKLNATLRPEQPLVVVQADLDSFGPSIIHDAALIALEFLGVTPGWINFFRKFLQPKIRFSEGDQAEKVLRGVPSSHALSNLFGETLLFLLDFLVNRKCNGLRLYRISDELWFWSHEQDAVKLAWDAISKFGGMVGLKVNSNRSGSVIVLSEQVFWSMFPTEEFSALPGKLIPGEDPLPQKSIHWGYLALGSNGIFQIDQKAVDKFLEEMKGLLDRSECVLEWINIFNKYFTFFIRNFGKSAIASGSQHLDQIISALNSIYRGLLSSSPDPGSLLRSRFSNMLSSGAGADLVDAWIYWPLERGGLGLVNPFIAVMALRETFSEQEKGSPLDRDFSKLPLQDVTLYADLKKAWEEGQMVQSGYRPQPVGPGNKLPSVEEYLAGRETQLGHWYTRYLHLLERPGPKYPSVGEGFHRLDWRGGSDDDESTRNYFMWLFSYYEPQLRDHFGSVTFINAKLLPMSMIGNIQKAKVLH